MKIGTIFCVVLIMSQTKSLPIQDKPAVIVEQQLLDPVISGILTVGGENVATATGQVLEIPASLIVGGKAKSLPTQQKPLLVLTQNALKPIDTTGVATVGGKNQVASAVGQIAGLPVALFVGGRT